MKYVLQSRWKLKGNQLIFFGMHNKNNLFKNKLSLHPFQIDIVASLPKVLTVREKRSLASLLNNAVVKEKDYRKVAASLDEARFCARCVANDFMIPGLEFDKEGLCPMCQTAELQKQLTSLVPQVATIPPTKEADYDVALFYTGGKDSSYLLYLLSEKMNLRVLALTWEIPFMSENAKASIEAAKQRFPAVRFVQKALTVKEGHSFYHKLYELSGTMCACPSLAYVLFYPDLVAQNIPYLVVGNEPIQMMGFYYNQLAPLIAYQFPNRKGLNTLLNMARVLQGRPRYQMGQFQTLATMRQLAYGDPWFKKHSRYNHDLTKHIVASLQTLPHLLEPLKNAIKHSSKTGRIPRFVQLDFEKVDQAYNWKAIQETIQKECGWIAPVGQQQLHTSCVLESCKANIQYRQFYHMESSLIPFSALEIALASAHNLINKEEALLEIRQAGFHLEPKEACTLMHRYLEGEHI